MLGKAQGWARKAAVSLRHSAGQDACCCLIEVADAKERFSQLCHFEFAATRVVCPEAGSLTGLCSSLCALPTFAALLCSLLRPPSGGDEGRLYEREGLPKLASDVAIE